MKHQNSSETGLSVGPLLCVLLVVLACAGFFFDVNHRFDEVAHEVSFLRSSLDARQNQVEEMQSEVSGLTDLDDRLGEIQRGTRTALG